MKTVWRRSLLLLMVLLASLTSAGNATDWPMFRGPKCDGTTSAAGVPVEWSPSSGIRWKTKIPKPGNGSAIVVGDRIFVTSVEDDKGRERRMSHASGVQPLIPSAFR